MLLGRSNGTTGSTSFLNILRLSFSEIAIKRKDFAPLEPDGRSDLEQVVFDLADAVGTVACLPFGEFDLPRM